MRALVRRVRRLEERFNPPSGTAFSRRLRQRLESAGLRVAAARERGELGPEPKQDAPFEAHGRRELGGAASHVAIDEERRQRGRST